MGWIVCKSRFAVRVGRQLIGLLLLSFLTGCGASVGQDGIETVESPARVGSAQPHLTKSPTGEIVLSWLAVRGEAHELRFAIFEDSAWSGATTVASGRNWFVNWADFPSVEPVSDQQWLAHWLVRQANSAFAYDVFIASSTDSGEHWSEPVKLHTDDSAAEHGFVSLFADGRAAGAVWLDGRPLADRAAAGMSLRSAVITGDGVISDEQGVDVLACDCCQTDVAAGPDGPLVVYRDRTLDEIRDIALVARVGGEWSKPQPVAGDGWRIAGCPINGPAIAAIDSQVVVAWYTAANDQPLIRFARSLDAGSSFAPAVVVSADQPLGRVDVVVLEDGQAAVSWMARTADGAASFNVRRVGPAGELGPTVQIARMAPSRPSGFPQMVRANDVLLFAWTDVSQRESMVRTARVSLRELE